MEQVLAIGILLLVQMIMMIVIVVKIGKMHGYISGITQRVETYLDVVLQEADCESDSPALADKRRFFRDGSNILFVRGESVDVVIPWCYSLNMKL